MRSASRLYQLRSARGWSLEELAARAGVSARTIYNAEVGDRCPQRATRSVLASALGCDPDDLLTKTESAVRGGALVKTDDRGDGREQI